jgi:hypothetical protein
MGMANPGCSVSISGNSNNAAERSAAYPDTARHRRIIAVLTDLRLSIEAFRGSL